MLDFLRSYFWQVAQGFQVADFNPSPAFIYGTCLFAILIATTVHEFGHAWMADKLGDPTPREQGRVTLSPAAHIDPLGALLLVATLLIGYPVGWGRPVQTDPRKYSCGVRWGSLLVAAAGPLMNLLTAIFLAPFARFILQGGLGGSEFVIYILLATIIVMLVNLSLFVFNLVPVYPLDGSHITASLLPEPLSRPYRYFMKHFGMYLLLALMVSGKLAEVLGPMILSLFLFLIGA